MLVDIEIVSQTINFVLLILLENFFIIIIITILVNGNFLMWKM